MPSEFNYALVQRLNALTVDIAQVTRGDEIVEKVYLDNLFGNTDEMLIFIKARLEELHARSDTDFGQLLTLRQSIRTFNETLELLGQCQSLAVFCAPCRTLDQHKDIDGALTAWSDLVNRIRELGPSRALTGGEVDARAQLLEIHRLLTTANSRMDEIVRPIRELCPRLYFVSNTYVVSAIAVTCVRHDIESGLGVVCAALGIAALVLEEETTVTHVIADSGERLALMTPVSLDDSAVAVITKLDHEMRVSAQRDVLESYLALYQGKKSLRAWVGTSCATATTTAYSAVIYQMYNDLRLAHHRAQQLPPKDAPAVAPLTSVLDRLEADLAEVRHWIQMGNKSIKASNLHAELLSLHDRISVLINDHAAEAFFQQSTTVTSEGHIQVHRFGTSIDVTPVFTSRRRVPSIAVPPSVTAFTDCLASYVVDGDALGVVLRETHDPSDVTSCLLAPTSEYVADLASLLGRKLVVADCSDERVVDRLHTVFLGCVLGNTWLCLNNVHTLPDTSRLMLVRGIENLRLAVQSDQDYITFEGKTYALPQQRGVLFLVHLGKYTTPWVAASMRQLPALEVPVLSTTEYLTARFVAMGYKPDDATAWTDIITESLYLAGQRGFSAPTRTTDELILLLAQHHRTDTRSPKVIIEVIVRTVLRSLVGDSRPEEVERVLSVLFPIVDGEMVAATTRRNDPVLRYPDTYGRGESFRTFCQALHYIVPLMPVRAVGPRGCGISSALAIASPEGVHIERIYLSTIPTSVIGRCNPQTNIWEDGVLLRLLRAVLTASATTWVVIGGHPRDEDVRHFASLLDAGRRHVILDSGEVIRIPPTVRFVWRAVPEDPHLPGPIASLLHDIVAGTHNFTPRELMHHMLATDTDNVLYPYRDFVEEKFALLLTTLIEFIDRTPDMEEVDLYSAVRTMVPLFNVFKTAPVSADGSRTYLEDNMRLRDTVVECMLVFAFVWSFGASVAHSMEMKLLFSKYLRGAVVDSDLMARFPIPLDTELGLVFDYHYDMREGEFSYWEKAVKAIPRDVHSDICQHTRAQHTLALHYILSSLARQKLPLLLSAPENSGVREIVTRISPALIEIQCTPDLTAHSLQEEISTRLQIVDRSRLSVPAGTAAPLVVCLIDIDNLPHSTIVFLNMVLDRKGWVDPSTHVVLSTEDITFVGITRPKCLEGVATSYRTRAALFHVVYEAEDEKRFFERHERAAELHLTSSASAHVLASCGLVPSLDPIDRDGLPIELGLVLNVPRKHVLLRCDGMVIEEETEVVETVLQRLYTVRTMQRLCLDESTRPEVVRASEAGVITLHGRPLLTPEVWLDTLRHAVRDALLMTSEKFLLVAVRSQSTASLVMSHVAHIAVTGSLVHLFTPDEVQTLFTSLQQQRTRTLEELRAYVQKSVRDLIRFVVVVPSHICEASTELQAMSSRDEVYFSLTLDDSSYFEDRALHDLSIPLKPDSVRNALAVINNINDHRRADLKLAPFSPNLMLRCLSQIVRDRRDPTLGVPAENAAIKWLCTTFGVPESLATDIPGAGRDAIAVGEEELKRMKEHPLYFDEALETVWLRLLSAPVAVVHDPLGLAGTVLASCCPEYVVRCTMRTLDACVDKGTSHQTYFVEDIDDATLSEDSLLRLIDLQRKIVLCTPHWKPRHAAVLQRLGLPGVVNAQPTTEQLHNKLSPRGARMVSAMVYMQAKLPEIDVLPIAAAIRRIVVAGADAPQILADLVRVYDPIVPGFQRALMKDADSRHALQESRSFAGTVFEDLVAEAHSVCHGVLVHHAADSELPLLTHLKAFAEQRGVTLHDRIIDEEPHFISKILTSCGSLECYVVLRRLQKGDGVVEYLGQLLRQWTCDDTVKTRLFLCVPDDCASSVPCSLKSHLWPVVFSSPNKIPVFRYAPVDPLRVLWGKTLDTSMDAIHRYVLCMLSPAEASATHLIAGFHGKLLQTLSRRVLDGFHPNMLKLRFRAMLMRVLPTVYPQLPVPWTEDVLDGMLTTPEGMFLPPADEERPKTPPQLLLMSTSPPSPVVGSTSVSRVGSASTQRRSVPNASTAPILSVLDAISDRAFTKARFVEADVLRWFDEPTCLHHEVVHSGITDEAHAWNRLARMVSLDVAMLRASVGRISADERCRSIEANLCRGFTPVEWLGRGAKPTAHVPLRKWLEDTDAAYTTMHRSIADGAYLASYPLASLCNLDGMLFCLRAIAGSGCVRARVILHLDCTPKTATGFIVSNVHAAVSDDGTGDTCVVSEGDGVVALAEFKLVTDNITDDRVLVPLYASVHHSRPICEVDLATWPTSRQPKPEGISCFVCQV
eukprot:PhM_4_TR14414/c0_g1_i1/m.18402/K10408/DNAH; dynein heavy chain, axonemal